MIGISILNPLYYTLVINYALCSILALFSGLILVQIILFSPIFVNEIPYKLQIFAVLCIIQHKIIIILSGDHTNNKYQTLDKVLLRYCELNFAIFIIQLFM